MCIIKTIMSNLSSGFIDLATYDDIESFLYSGHKAVTYFIRQHKKSSWFTQVPVTLTVSNGTPDFGASWSVNISRAGDYLLHTWLEVVCPAITPLAAGAIAAPATVTVETLTNTISTGANWVGSYQVQFVTASGGQITPGMTLTGTGISAGTKVLSVLFTATTAGGIMTINNPLTASLVDAATLTLTKLDFQNFWAKNFMHNLIEECTLTVNDLIAHKLNSESLDFWAEFNVPCGKRVGYDRMIGAGIETHQETSKGCYFLHGIDASVARTFTLPLPFFFTRESGVALPTAAIPYNDMRIHFKFRAINDLLATCLAAGTSVATVVATHYTVPTTKMVAKVYANYAIVSNDERQLMGCTPRDIVIEQNQTAPITTLTSATATKTYDIRFSHAVKTLNFAIRNKKLYTNAQNVSMPGSLGYGGDFFSNYTRKSIAQENAVSTLGSATQGAPYIRTSAIATTSLLYENTTRLSNLPASYFTKVNPYYHQTTIPTEDGIHSYSYSLDSSSIDPMGSTNYGKLTNVSLSITPASGIELFTGLANATDDLTPADCDVVICAVSHNVIRVSGGAVGFPVL